MSSLTLEQAARASGRSAREIRLLLEEGRVRGSVLAGRWHVEPSEVDALTAETPPTEPQLRVLPPPGGGPAGPGAPPAGPGAPPGGPGAPPATPAAAVEELVSRLEQRAIEVARLRGELEALREGRDEHGARVERELDGLRRELGDAREELRRAHDRIAELDADDGARSEQVRQQRPGMSEALSPLFQPTGGR